MILYDQTSPIDWFYDGQLQPEDMRGSEMYGRLFEEPCVLYDDGAGRVYSFEPLAAIASRCAVPMTGDAESAFDSCMAVMSGTYRAPGVAEVEEKADAAQTAAQTASETAATAQTTADEAKATADTAAASMNEYMDALLGLDTTDETEAADAE